MPETALQPPLPGRLTADVWPHPLTAAGRETRRLAAAPGATLAGLIAVQWPGAPERIVAAVDGRLVPRAVWAETPLSDGVLVTLRMGLGDGGSDSDPLRVVLQLAVVAAGLYFPPALGLTAGTFAYAAAGAAISVGGSLIINAIAPPRLPEPPTSPTRNASPAPVYTVTGGANRARPYEPLLLVLGKHRVFPDLSAREYTEFSGGEQYLNQIFHFGLGNLDIGTLELGDSPLSQLDEVQTLWARGGGRLTLLVAGNVDTEFGGSLDHNDWITRTTPADTTRIALDIVGQLFQYNSRTGRVERRTENIAIQYWPEGDAVRVTAHRVTLAHASTQPYRRTFAYRLPAPGAYGVRVRRTGTFVSTPRVTETLTFAALRSYQRDPGDYAGQTRLGVRIRASGQVSGRLERLSAIVKQKIPVWDGRRWSAPRPSSNPAWLYRWYALGIQVGGRLAAGAGLDPGRIDEAGLKAWGAWCEEQRLECNLVIDRAMSHAEVLTLIAQCGRASPSWQTGKLGVVWDAADKPVTALVTPGNIVAGSFEAEWAGAKVADEVACRYIEPGLDWQWHTVRRAVPGVMRTGATATLTLAGVTSARQAAMECNLQAARQRYHRRRLGWEMGEEGFAIARGDVVHLTHALIDGGVAGRLLAGTPERLVLERPVTLSGDDYLLLRLPEGQLHTSRITHPHGEGAAGETDTVILDTPLPAAPDADGADALDTLFRLYPGDAPPARVRIVAVEPRAGGERIRFTAIDEVEAYHNAATADLSVPLPDIRRHHARVLAIDLAETLVRAGSGFLVQLTATLTVAGPWRGGILRASLDGDAPRTVAKLTDAETEAFWLSPPSGVLTVTAIPGSEAVSLGGALTVEYAIQGKLAPPGTPANFLIDVLGDGTRRLRWTPPPDPDLAGVLIRYAETTGRDAVAPEWDQMMPLHTGPLTASPYETNTPRAGNWTFAARALDTSGLLSDAVYIRAELPDPRLGDTLLWECPSAEGWPGSATQAVRSEDGTDALEGEGAYAWDDMSTWDDWVSWALGDGDDGAREMIYTAPAVDLGAALTFGLDWSADVAGETTLQARTADTEAALATAPWGDYTPGATRTARWVQLRWRLTGDGTVGLRLDHLCFSVLAPTREERLRDADTAAWAGSAAAGRQIPTQLATVVDVDLTLQSVGAGWSWSLAAKAPPTVKIFNGDGQPADATVDAVVRGVAA